MMGWWTYFGLSMSNGSSKVTKKGSSCFNALGPSVDVVECLVAISMSSCFVVLVAGSMTSCASCAFADCADIVKSDLNVVTVIRR